MTLELRIGSRKPCTCGKCAPKAQPTEQVPGPTNLAAAVAAHQAKDQQPTERHLEKPFDLAAFMKAGIKEVQ